VEAQRSTLPVATWLWTGETTKIPNAHITNIFDARPAIAGPRRLRRLFPGLALPRRGGINPRRPTFQTASNRQPPIRMVDGCPAPGLGGLAPYKTRAPGGRETSYWFFAGRPGWFFFYDRQLFGSSMAVD